MDSIDLQIEFIAFKEALQLSNNVYVTYFGKGRNKMAGLADITTDKLIVSLMPLKELSKYMKGYIDGNKNKFGSYQI